MADDNVVMEITGKERPQEVFLSSKEVGPSSPVALDTIFNTYVTPAHDVVEDTKKQESLEVSQPPKKVDLLLSAETRKKVSTSVATTNNFVEDTEKKKFTGGPYIIVRRIEVKS